MTGAGRSLPFDFREPIFKRPIPSPNVSAFVFGRQRDGESL
jgi:hypothetical protein